ncbi:MAG: hypothetical protein GY804_06855, partial [Alphaproteobacteria bacterium]|nr:hypothetical protein [Alphaproteobacteria bacterium]
IVDYKIFYGDTKNIDDPCWFALENYVYNQEFSICGEPDCTIAYCAVDAGYNPGKGDPRNKDFESKAHVVYEFVSRRTDRFMAIMGSPDDSKMLGYIKESKISDMKTSLTKRYMVAVSLLKTEIMDVIEHDSGFNAIHVPKWQAEGQETPDEFYMQFLSEVFQEDPEKKIMKWTKIRDRNEVLDTFIYSIAAAEFRNIRSWNIEAWSSYYYGLVGE